MNKQNGSLNEGYQPRQNGDNRGYQPKPGANNCYQPLTGSSTPPPPPKTRSNATKAQK